MEPSYKLYIHNLRQIVQVTARADCMHLAGEAQNHPLVVDGRRLAVLVGLDGRIVEIGEEGDITRDVRDCRRVIDGRQGVLLPGFVDAHTHPVFAGDRVNEFAMKLQGKTYMEIHAAGGGIHSTVEATRAASEDILLDSLMERCRRIIRRGTTSMEAKSGYGLNAETEMKMMRVLHRANGVGTLPNISITFCGGHAIPKGMDADQAVEDICSKQVPQIVEAVRSGSLVVNNVDVFCEKGVFDTEQTKTICATTTRALPNVKVNIHGDELSNIGAAAQAVSLDAHVISHLEECDDEGVAAMARRGTIAVLLPTTAYMLKLKSPPARAMIAAGVPVALGSDFNPNAYCYDMAVVMHLTCCLFGLTMEEALVGATLNAAASIGMSVERGAVSVGRVADLVVYNVAHWHHVVYQFGGSTDIIAAVVKGGEIVHKAE